MVEQLKGNDQVKLWSYNQQMCLSWFQQRLKKILNSLFLFPLLLTGAMEHLLLRQGLCTSV